MLRKQFRSVIANEKDDKRIENVPTFFEHNAYGVQKYVILVLQTKT